LGSKSCLEMSSTFFEAENGREPSPFSMAERSSTVSFRYDCLI
jgi:hypothetical protein